MTADAETIPLRVTLGHTGDDSLNLRFPPEYGEELLSLLDENGIGHNTALEMSAGPAEWIEVVDVLGAAGVTGLAALAVVISKFGHRHDGKRFGLKIDGVEINADGYSVKEIEQLLKKLPPKQAELDAETRRVLGRTLETDD
ncbi:hypothetical protein E3T35_06155 [Cryobacterium sp. TMT1-2-2]|uniref:hypothetical protein n=1 Tax=Cryobacterium sp. TMT1-2-2 TaxID=1259233 RepID=UPI00106DCC17|nr:hypothetical protein [Cryobacterium sp. TMT1-2-2]TFD12868.1 hypothetical protein E3T35_06155 [Cryobacterium sp. TMT1-2-2]